MLPDDACSQITTGHSALRTMWLSAPVLTFLLISSTECMRRPNRFRHAWVRGIAVVD